MAKNGTPLFDNDNLEQAKLIVDKINQLIKETEKTSTMQAADVKELIRLYNELAKVCNLTNKLNEQAIASKNKEFKEQINNIEASVNSMTNSVNQAKTLDDVTSKLLDKAVNMSKTQKSLYDSVLESAKRSGTGNAVSGNTLTDVIANSVSKNIQNSGNKATEKLAKEIADEVIKANGGTVTEENKSKIRSEINERMNSKEAIATFTASSMKTQAAATLLNTAVKTFKEAVSTFANMFTSGLNSQADTYNSTFSNISVRTGTTRGEYQSQQIQLQSDLWSEGLFNNIASSDVQEMWNSLASSGFSQENMFENALDNVLTNKIVPYLDTTSTQFNLINNRLGGEFTKQIRGINQATVAMSGSSIMNEKVVTSMMDNLQIMGDEALENLATSSTELSNFANELVSTYGFSEDEANEVITSIYNMQEYGATDLSKLSTAEKVAYLSILENPDLNLYDSGDYLEVAATMLQSQKDLAENTIGLSADSYNSTVSGTLTNTAGGALGLDFEHLQELIKLLGDEDTQEYTAEEIIAKSRLTEEELEAYAEQATSDYANDVNQTQEELQEITMENISTEFAILKERLGGWFDVLTTAVKGIGTALGLYLGAKGLGKLTDLITGSAGSASSGLLAALGTGGAVALGIASVGAGIIAGLEIVASQLDDNKDDRDETAQNAYDTYIANGASTSSAIVGAITDASQNSTPIDIENWGNLTDEMADELGIDKSLLKASGTEVNDALEQYESRQDWDAYNKIQIGRWYYGTSGEVRSQFVDLLAALDILGLTGDSQIMQPLMDITKLDALSSLTTSDITSMLNEVHDPNYASKYALSNIQKLFSSELSLYTTEGQRVDIGSISQDSLKEHFGILRQGLAEVPYDDYPALLHEGEAVLTASTSNQLSNLLDYYRENGDTNIETASAIQTFIDNTENADIGTTLSDLTNANAETSTADTEILSDISNQYSDTVEQSATFETIIRNQTVELVAKLDELINAVNGTMTETTTENSTSRKILTNAMKMRSTNSLLATT